MGKRAAFTAHALDTAAAVAVRHGVAVILEAPDGTVYRIAPDGASSIPPLGREARECDEADKAFGLSE